MGLRSAAAAVLALLLVAGCAKEPPLAGLDRAVSVGELTVAPVSYGELEGWSADDHAEALAAFRRSCGKGRSGHPALQVTREDWAQVCARAAATEPSAAKRFFERNFQPVRLSTGTPALFTGYFEPELEGSRVRGGPYQHPLYRKPPGFRPGGRRSYSRAQIDEGALAGRGLEMFWVTDPVESFFLHIQGSGRVRLPDGQVVRVGYAGQNGHAYRSVGRILVDRGVIRLEDVTADRLKDWLRANPQAAAAVMRENPSYVFFRELPGLDPALGPLGAVEAPLTAMRSIAVDRRYTPLGAPVWIDSPSPAGRIARLTVAQDTGGAVKGAQRADIFFGTGSSAGYAAGLMKHQGDMVALVPRTAAVRVAAAR